MRHPVWAQAGGESASSGSLWPGGGASLQLPMLGPLPCPLSSLQFARLGVMTDTTMDACACSRTRQHPLPPSKAVLPFAGALHLQCSPAGFPWQFWLDEIARSVCLQEKNCLRQACQNPSQPDTQLFVSFFFFFLIKTKKSQTETLHKAEAVWLVSLFPLADLVFQL